MRILYLFLAFFTVILFGCGGGSGPTIAPPSPSRASVTMNFGLARDYQSRSITDIKSISVKISGAQMQDITDTFVFEGQPSQSHNYQVPVGIDRHFLINALDSTGKAIYSGESDQDVVAGANTVSVDLFPSNVFGSASIKVSIPNIQPPYGKLPGLCLSVYIDGQDPNAGSQIAEDQMRSRLSQTWPLVDKYVRNFSSTDGNENFGKVARSLGGKHITQGIWLGRDRSRNDLEIARGIAVAQAGQCDQLSVGSEALLRGDIPAGSSASQSGDGTLIGYIKQVRASVDSLGVLVTYADIYSVLLQNPDVVNACSGPLFANIYPFWEANDIGQAFESFKASFVKLQSNYPNSKFAVGETGWPTDGGANGQAVPSEANSRRYLKQVVDWIRMNGYICYWFSGHDEKWKTAEGSVGSHWGILTSDGQMKTGYRELRLGI